MKKQQEQLPEWARVLIYLLSGELEILQKKLKNVNNENIEPQIY